MLIIKRIIAVMIILLGIVIAGAGYSITIGALKNPTSNQWFDAIWILLGIFTMFFGAYRLECTANA